MLKKSRITSFFQRPIAHRGLHDHQHGTIENTRTAFQHAIDHGYAIECDLQLTADDDAVVFHDLTLDRLATTQGIVRDFTMAQLTNINLKSTTDHMQSLYALLQQVNGVVPLIVEIKSRWDGNIMLAERAALLIENYRGPVALMSFDPSQIAFLQRHFNHIPRGIVADRVHDAEYEKLSLARRLSLRNFEHIEETRPHFVSYDHNKLPYAPLQQMRAAGIPIICWTIKSLEQAFRALRYSDQITFEGFLPAP